MSSGVRFNNVQLGIVTIASEAQCDSRQAVAAQALSAVTACICWPRPHQAIEYTRVNGRARSLTYLLAAASYYPLSTITTRRHRCPMESILARRGAVVANRCLSTTFERAIASWHGWCVEATYTHSSGHKTCLEILERQRRTARCITTVTNNSTVM